MSGKRVVKTAIGVTTVAAAGAAGYAYLHPEVIPIEVAKVLKDYNLLSIDSSSKNTSTSLINSMKDNLGFESKKAVKNDISAEKSVSVPVLDYRQTVTTDFSADKKKSANIKPVNVKKLVEELEKKPEPTAAEKARQREELEKRILDTLQKTEKHVKSATDAKYKTVQAIKLHAQTLKQAVDDGTRGNWSAVNDALAKSESLSKADIVEESAARDHIDALRKIVDDSRKTPIGSESSLVFMSSETANKLSHQLDELNYLAEKARLDRRIFNKYKDLIEKSRQHFAQELNSIVPGIDINAKDKSLTNDELNALIAHAYLRVDQLRQQLIEQQVKEEKHIADAIEEQQKVDAKVAQAQLDLEVRRVRESKDLDVEKKVSEERRLWEQELESRLQRASLAHAEHLENVVRTQKQLHDIENAKLVEDAENRRAKQYWLACQNLIDSIVYGIKAGNTIETRRKPLGAELKVIKEACENDSFVQSITNLFPKSSLENGVFTEQDLRNRFMKLYKLGRATAKIDENGGGLLKYVMSYLQSWLMVELPRAYSADDKINVDAADTYEVLARAKYFVERGDFASAIRVVQLLDGQPGRLAHDWIADARAHLETLFLARLLVAHATVTSIRSVY